MSTNPDAEVDAIVGSEEVTVTKMFDPESYSVPTIVYDIDLPDAATEVEIVDEVLGSAGPDDIGFHPEYGKEYWTTDDSAIRFNAVFGPETGNYVTVIGLKSAEYVDEFRDSEPTVEVRTGEAGDLLEGREGGEAVDPQAEGPLPPEGEPPAEGEPGEAPPAGAGAGGTRAAGGAVNVEAELAELRERVEAVSQRADAAAEHDEMEAELAELRERVETMGDRVENAVERANEAATEAERAAKAANEVAEEARISDQDVLARLKEQIAAIDAEDEVVELREESWTESERARVEHVESRLSELEAYTGAIEDFIDENGQARQLLEELRERHGQLETELASVRGQAQEATELVGRVENREDAAERRLDTAESRLNDLDEATAANADRLDEHDDRIAERAKQLHKEIDGVRSDIDDRLDELEERIAANRDDIDQLEQLREELEALKELRERLNEAFGSAVGNPVDVDD